MNWGRDFKGDLTIKRHKPVYLIIKKIVHKSPAVTFLMKKFQTFYESASLVFNAQKKEFVFHLLRTRLMKAIWYLSQCNWRSFVCVLLRLTLLERFSFSIKRGYWWLNVSLQISLTMRDWCISRNVDFWKSQWNLLIKPFLAKFCFDLIENRL